MTNDRALIALVAGTALAGVATLFSLAPAVAIAGWAVGLVALSRLAKSSDAFGGARLGVVLGLVGSALAVADVQVRVADWLVLLGLLLLLTGSCAGLRELLPDGSRRAAAGRISGAALLTMLALALLVALDQAAAGPVWVTDAMTVARVAAAVVVAWFLAYAVAARPVVPVRAS